MSKSMPIPYPQAPKVGAQILREVVPSLRRAGIALPVKSQILVACSGGADSVALAHLLAQYGRRVGSKISLLHINHHLRGHDSKHDERFVRELAKSLNVKFICHALTPAQAKKGESIEGFCRRERKKIFQAEATQKNALVFTAHHAEDLAETMLWRLFTGSSKTHGGGILIKDGPIVRPFLKISKTLLREYLTQVNQAHCEDATNEDVKFLRNSIRKKLLPEICALFPRAVERLGELAIAAQGLKTAENQDAIQDFFSMKAGALRGEHWREIKKTLEAKAPSVRLELPDGWSLTRPKLERMHRQELRERWVLDRKKL